MSTSRCEKKTVAFDALVSCIELCNACELSKTAQRRVVGSGTLLARVMLLGEAPGAHEDKTGEPFVGAAGKRLDVLLHLAKLSREDIYIANVLKCRPPKNRDPRSEEIAACKPYLEKQIKLIKPKVLVSMGNFSTQFLLGKDVRISEVHGRFFRQDEQVVFPVYHPAAAIYDPHKQGALEADFAALGAFLRGDELA